MKKYLLVLFFIMLLSFGYTAEQMHKLSGTLHGNVRVIEVTASKYKFVPDPIVVKLGEKVRLLVDSTDVTHGLAITEFKINAVIRPDIIDKIEFTADKEGTFRIFCSVYCGPGHSHMHGTLIVVK